MKKIKAVATELGLGLIGVYLFFLIPQIEQNFSPNFILLLRQVVSLGFGLCVFTNIRGLIDAGEKILPKVLSIGRVLLDILNIIINRKNEK